MNLASIVIMKKRSMIYSGFHKIKEERPILEEDNEEEVFEIKVDGMIKVKPFNVPEFIQPPHRKGDTGDVEYDSN